MLDKVDMNFPERFKQLTGHPPFPWQERLFTRVVANTIPRRCDIPTGLGKTSVIAVWLLAREMNPAIPRRLVYVVNRRTVVDQTTEEVKKYQEAGKDIALSTLRGEFEDNRQWSSDPSREAVICGTVDMIGSRLLFSGYGLGFRTRPMHAGFLGHDALLIHDEAHLEPAFQKLVEAIEKEQDKCDFERSRFRVMELSATSRTAADDHKDDDVFTLNDADRANEIVRRRIHATKKLTLDEVPDKGKVADRLAELALTHEPSGHAVLVFVRTIDDLAKVLGKLPDGRKVQLTGTMRGKERDDLITMPTFRRFLPNAESGTETVYLVATSAGEVGVNLSADHLVSDLSPYESMAQRFGRLNRFGDRNDSLAHVVYPAAFDKDPLSKARQETLVLLRSLEGNASPSHLREALKKLSAKDRNATFSPPPKILLASDILFDAWALTSIVKSMPGRPPVEPYLHGESEDDLPETQVAWRQDVRLIAGNVLAENHARDLLDEYPVKSHEVLRDTTKRVWKELEKLARRSPNSPIWIVGNDGEVDTNWTLGRVLADSRDPMALIANKMVLLPDDIGGLTREGLLSGDDLRHDLRDTEKGLDVADDWLDGSRGNQQWRQRFFYDPEESPAVPDGMKIIRTLAVCPPEEDKTEEQLEDEDEKEPTHIWYWLVRITAAPNDARGRDPYLLERHLEDAKRVATGLTKMLSLSPALRDLVILTSSLHDIGKKREGWQKAIGNNNFKEKPWAKSPKRRGRIESTSYRHEFGSLMDLSVKPSPSSAFDELLDDLQELASHLLAAHHGRARPHFQADESIDDKHPVDLTITEGLKVPCRFARLQHKYGRWGLAYLESLIRAADYRASEEADAKGDGK